MSRRAKIVATLGPAVNTPESIRALIEAGVNVTRFNLSHGDHSVHEANYRLVRDAAEKADEAIAILVDLQGPKIRLGTFADGPHRLEAGDTFTITVDDVEGTKDRVSTTYKGLSGDVHPGDDLLIDDGAVRVRAIEVDERSVTTEVIVPGTVSNNKGINLPGVAVNVPALSEKDENDLRWALRIGADMIALSFVRGPDDIVRVHEIMAEEGVTLPVIAKIEKPQAVEHLREIVDAFDGIMVARGDLGVELPLEQVPIVQKRAIELARRRAKPSIVATQMLETMIQNPRPTRAEASDCANAVLDGADALMLSGETSVGAHPITAVETMARLIESTEAHGLDRIPPLGTKPFTQGGAITLAAAEVGEFLGARYYCVFTESGDSVRRMSRLRAGIPILGFTPRESIRRRMNLYWGVSAFLVDRVMHTDEMFMQVDQTLLDLGLAGRGEKVVIVAGMPPGIAGSTNDMRVHTIGDAVDAAAPAYEARHSRFPVPGLRTSGADTAAGSGE
ncbi:pyruvate kinase [Pseudoclavibacter endophyticus]|uniref:Pyruvate kinase n=1 Tax=Pseudoclavibacter endophyticus TaxID=1778590 RepID=A0A6H9WQZ4_9MICO|nr:pyruvate kinase [Pseudoclavibacter endophyticus]KAB1650111.1 pyruvate kinase [Pseudoclavibacter endophyticus]GGA57147.1 pyruvate kinase [Pseudoclavibacter endophyticus]